MSGARRILLLQGHPDAGTPHLCHALAQAYAQGEEEGGHEVRSIEVARIDFPLLTSQHEWEHGTLPLALKPAQEVIAWAEHIVLFFPLWLGDMPALLKGFLEQVARPGFAFQYGADKGGGFPHKGLAGRSARVVVTMGMPAVAYRWFYRAHSVKSLERNILAFVGIAPVERTLIGGVGGLKERDAQRWLARMRDLGRDAA